MIRVLLCVIYWWNPLIWAAAACVREDAELACDARVLRGQSVEEKRAYGYALLRLLEQAQGRGGALCAATSMHGGRKSMKRRMEGITSVNVTRRSALLAVCLLLTAALLFGCGIPSGDGWLLQKGSRMESKDGFSYETEYEYAFLEEIRSMLIYYESYRWGELTERRVIACDQVPESRKGELTVGLEENEEQATLMIGWGPASSFFVMKNSYVSGIHAGTALKLQENESVKLHPEDDLVLLADFQAERKEELIAHSGEELSGLTEEEMQDVLGDNCQTILVRMAVSARDSEELRRLYERRATPAAGETEKVTEESQAFVTRWAQAFVARDAEALLSMMDMEARRELTEEGFLEEDGEQIFFGWSSPWPMFGEQLYRILSADDGRAEILYYAGDSTPHLYVWRETLELERQGETFRVKSDTLEMLDNISSVEAFYQAYPDGVISGTPMDYEKNGLGEALNRNAVQQRDASDYAKLFDVRMAALNLLNIDGYEEGKITVASEMTGETARVRITFQEDDVSVEVRMVQPWGEVGIWIPQT